MCLLIVCAYETFVSGGIIAVSDVCTVTILHSVFFSTFSIHLPFLGILQCHCPPFQCRLHIL